MDSDLSEPETAIVDVLDEDRATTGYIVDQSGYSRAHVNTHLRILLAKDLIRKVHPPTALYESVDHARAISIDTAAAGLSEPEAAIVDILCGGRATTGYMVDQSDYSRAHVNTHLRILLAKDLIRKVHPPTALYELDESSIK